MILSSTSWRDESISDSAENNLVACSCGIERIGAPLSVQLKMRAPFSSPFFALQNSTEALEGVRGLFSGLIGSAAGLMLVDIMVLIQLVKVGPVQQRGQQVILSLFSIFLSIGIPCTLSTQSPSSSLSRDIFHHYNYFLQSIIIQ